MSDQLLPCPFCGEQAMLWEGQPPLKAWQVRCSECNTEQTTNEGIEKARATWNRRPIAMSIHARLAEAHRGMSRAEAERDAALDRAKKAEAFKTYVHKRLDGAGVPVDPKPEQTAKTGCRIEGRIDRVLAEYDHRPRS